MVHESIYCSRILDRISVNVSLRLRKIRKISKVLLNVRFVKNGIKKKISK